MQTSVSYISVCHLTFFPCILLCLYCLVRIITVHMPMKMYACHCAYKVETSDSGEKKGN